MGPAASTPTSSPTTTITPRQNIEILRTLDSGSVTAIILSIIILVAVLGFGYWHFKKNRQIAPSHNVNAYDNPIYDADMESAVKEPSLYTDVPDNSFNEDGYMDVSSQNEVSSFYNTGMDSPELLNSITNTESDL